MSKALIAVGGILGSLYLCGPASAAMVGPGESAVLSSSEYGEPAGELIAEKLVPLAIEYGDLDDGSEGSIGYTLTGSFRSQVYRTADQTLTFVYSVDVDDVEGTDEGVAFAVGSFSSYATDVMADFVWSDQVNVARSADGTLITLLAERGGTPRVSIDTDAMAYGGFGTSTFIASGEVPAGFDTDSGDEAEMILAGGSASFEGTLVPISAVPLPPAVAAGVLVLGVMSGVQWARRRRES